MARLKSPAGAVVDVPDAKVKRLVEIGFTRVDDRPAPKPKRRSNTK